MALACLADKSMPARIGSSRRGHCSRPIPAPPVHDAAIRAYWLTVRGELFERANQLDRAIADYGAALALEPQNDSIRATLADALLARGERHDARELLNVERPGLALLVRRAGVPPAPNARRCARRPSLAGPRSARAAIPSMHAKPPCWRWMAAMPRERCVGGAGEFRAQKELADVRLLARAAVAAQRPGRAAASSPTGCAAPGIRDAVTENILDGASAG